MLERDEYVRLVRAAASDIATILATADPRTPVTTCPGWDLSDLVRHLGSVHRWAAACIRADGPTDEPEGPTDLGALQEWFEAGAADLVALLSDVDPLRPTWTFGPPPRLAGFWQRRQAHETVMHRWDARHALGHEDPIDPLLAADGLDEAASMFFPRQVRLARIEPLEKGLRLVAVDVPAAQVTFAGDGTDPFARVDATAHATASDLLLGVWGRRSWRGWDIEGDSSAVERVLSVGVVP